MPHQSKAPDRERDARLARGLADDLRGRQQATADLVQALAGVQMPARAGQHSSRSLEALAADSGFSSAGREEMSPVLSIGGRVYR